MPNFVLKGEVSRALVDELAANTPAAQDFKSQIGVPNPTTPTVPDYTPAAVKTMVMDLLNNDADVIARIKVISKMP